jgi:mitochondrial fission protein ELM1
MSQPPRVWVLADERPGNANQALGVAEALGWPFEVRELRFGRLARLPNLILGHSLAGLTENSRAGLAPPWPDVVIAAGRRSAPVARWLKERHPQAFLVQLMWPGSAKGFDLIAVPEHDRARAAPNLIRTLGAPHRITAARLAEAGAAFAPLHADLPRPWIACLIGGSSRHGGFAPDDAARLAHDAIALAEARGGSLLVVTSRRTGAACEQEVADGLAGSPHVLHRWSRSGDNPYLGVLGSADAILVTADSASMCTEACASGRPVLLWRAGMRVPGKLERLHRRLEEDGHLQPIGAPWPGRMPPALRPAETVARAIRERLGTATAPGRVACTAPGN